MRQQQGWAARRAPPPVRPSCGLGPSLGGAGGPDRPARPSFVSPKSCSGGICSSGSSRPPLTSGWIALQYTACFGARDTAGADAVVVEPEVRREDGRSKKYGRGRSDSPGSPLYLVGRSTMRRRTMGIAVVSDELNSA